MTNAEKFTEVFGYDLHREYATKTWWEQEYEQLPPVKAEIKEKCRYNLSADCHSHYCLSCMLDKIRAEIEKAVWEDVIVSLDGTDEVRIPCLDPDDVFEIIDKYKVESEEE